MALTLAGWLAEESRILHAAQRDLADLRARNGVARAAHEAARAAAEAGGDPNYGVLCQEDDKYLEAVIRRGRQVQGAEPCDCGHQGRPFFLGPNIRFGPCGVCQRAQVAYDTSRRAGDPRPGLPSAWCAGPFER